ncbi:MAG: wapA2 [Clostridiaceae bacterium]|nr:wapA2 [Clostridiaceae bacterium]
MYYLQSRYYNAEWGRFINSDGVVGTSGELLSGNMFAYCKNNPINMEDSSGYWPTLSSILNSAKKLVKNVVENVKKVVARTAVILTAIVFTIIRNPNIAQAIIVPAASRKLINTSRSISKTSKSFSKSYPSQKAAQKAAFRDAGIGKHGKSTPINNVHFNKGSRQPFEGTKQVRPGWVGEKGHEVFLDKWGHKEEPFDMPHFNVYFKDGRTGHYYYPSSWDPKNNR